MKKLKVMTVVGTRPEIIRLACVLGRLDDSEAVEHVLVHTGQNYDHELNDVFFADFSLRSPDVFLGAAGDNAAETIGKILIAIDPVFEEHLPDALLILGDTNSCLCAIPAKKRKIPIFHMEAGNRCFDQRVPEETNRKIVDHISDINLTYSDIAREYLLREGIPADRVIKTGSPMREVLTKWAAEIRSSGVLDQLGLRGGEYFVVSSHREENIDSENFGKLVSVINGVAAEYALPIVVSVHPRTRNRIVESGCEFSPLVRLVKPLGFHDYNHLQMNAKAVLSDSGTVSEESSIHNFPAVNLRESHERPEAMEEGSVMMCGMSLERVLQALRVLETQKRGSQRNLSLVSDYAVKNVSEKVLRILLSYTDYVNRVVWMKG